MAENFPNLLKETFTSRKHRVPDNMNPKILTPRLIIINTSKVKDRENFKSLKKKQVITYKTTPMRL